MKTKDLIAKRERRARAKARAERNTTPSPKPKHELSNQENDMLPGEFSEQILKELKHLPTHISDEEILRRRDMRDILTFTIDPDDAKDFDDAVTLKILNNGNYLLKVCIADVSEYVKENSFLDLEAYTRGTSVYLPDLSSSISATITSLSTPSFNEQIPLESSKGSIGITLSGK